MAAVQPTHLTAMDARARVRGDAQARLRERVTARATPDRARTPSPLEGRYQREARRTLSGERAPNARDPYVRHQAEIREQLRANGALGPANSRVHVDDVDREHGRSVARTAAGRTALIQGGDVSVNTQGLPRGFRSQHLSAAEQQRFDSFNGRIEQMMTRGNPTLQDHTRIAAESMVQSVREKQMRLENVRRNTPNDGRPTFVNMSWGQTRHEAAQNIMGSIGMSPENSPARQEVRRFLGGRDPQNERDVDRVMRGLIYPQLDRAMQTPEHRAQMQQARDGLEAEVQRGRDANILVFQSAANSFEDASRLGRPEFSASSTSGIRGMITVGAHDINGPGPKDDRVSSFSSSGAVDIAAPGTNMPVGRNRSMQDGTSFSSPYMADVARAMAAANPRLNANDIARLMADPRASRDIPGTTRDGRGAIDPFAAVMIARDPTMTREQIEAARMRRR